MRLARPKDNLQRLLGFKFHFVGRFSRKQRAASIWFKEGFMPLNTLKCDIDYGCYNLPLKNSAINVKV
jgi:ribosomal protein S3